MRLADVRRILVLSRNHIGDCLLTTPLLRALKRGCPRALLTVSIPRANRDLLVTNPHVDDLLYRPRQSSWAAKFAFGLQVRRRRFDLIVSLQEKSLFYAWTSWATARLQPGLATVSLDHPRTRSFYQHRSPVEPERHEVEKYLGIATLLGCPVEPNPVLELEPTPSSRERIEILLSGHGLDRAARFVALNPGGTRPEKRWPVERLAQVGDRLHTELGLPVVILGGPDDHERASRIAERMSSPPIVAAGRTTLADTAALLERCELLVTGDTGPMHMAVALAVPVVALFGPTNPAKFGPYTTLSTVLRHAEPCPRCASPCIHTIEVEECVEAARSLYQAPPARRPQTDPR